MNLYDEILRADPDDFLTFSELFRGLPHARPRVNQGWLRDVWFNAIQTEVAVADLAGFCVPTAELAELFHETTRTGYSTEVVSPAGARLLARLYRAGVLDTGKKKPEEPSAEFLAYCASEPQLLGKARMRALEKAGKQQAERVYRERLTKPDCFTEDEFTYRLLDDLFWHHKGAGGGELVIGGVCVSKEVAAYCSNSGKSRDYRVRFVWRSSDGKHRELTKHSAFESNRRNDEKRNWGLPE